MIGTFFRSAIRELAWERGERFGYSSQSQGQSPSFEERHAMTEATADTPIKVYWQPG